MCTPNWHQIRDFQNFLTAPISRHHTQFTAAPKEQQMLAESSGKNNTSLLYHYQNPKAMDQMISNFSSTPL